MHIAPLPDPAFPDHGRELLRPHGFLMIGIAPVCIGMIEIASLDLARCLAHQFHEVLQDIRILPVLIGCDPDLLRLDQPSGLPVFPEALQRPVQDPRSLQEQLGDNIRIA